ncbi:MAG: DUF4388 domain-containing protein [Desulfobulbaceae bacterium]|nr:DUF4388 domain-containing protein [Desulfobulbaceae bacterium]
MNEFSVAFKVVSERSCPLYAADDLFVLTGQAVQMPMGHASCLILIREMTNLLFNTIAPAAATGFEEIKDEIFNCGGCTGLIKFQMEDNPEILDLEHDAASGESPDSESTAQGKEDGKRNGVVVSGEISEISPSELLQFFHMHQKTGKLILDAAGGTGRVAFREGAIIGAKFQERENKEAIFALLRERRGRFNFFRGIPPSLFEVEDIGDFMMILMEGIKRMDEEEG